MRNATQADVDLAKKTGVLQENVMYAIRHSVDLVHGKKTTDVVRAALGLAVLAETSDGLVRTVYLDCLEPNSVPPTPKKPKRQPKKGTKPWPAYNPETIKVGDVVHLRNGDIASVGFVSGTDIQVGGHWYKHIGTGRFSASGKHGLDIVGMYQEPIAEKSQEEKDFDAGYWVPHLGEKQPKWVVGKSVSVILTGGAMPVPRIGQDWWWGRQQAGYNTIVAYKKA